MDASPLDSLLLRTPRLELRLPTVEEVLELARVAERGIHPPEEMPFGVAWSDHIGEEHWPASFLEFHEAARRDIRPEEWSLEFVTFLDGRPIGTQAVLASDFARTKLVRTGSWLGGEFQRRGYGTEQRSAVLALAFDGLGADAAISGAIEGNIASARVSEKLGYVAAEVGTVSPRGEPVQHTDYRLDRETWSRVEHPPVKITGLEPCLPLLGATSPGAAEAS